MKAFLVFLCFVGALHAAEPLFETICIFPITPNNKPNYRIPSIIQAPNGDVLIIAERRNDGPGDIGDHDIVLKRSRDRGKTWSAEQLIFDDEKRVCTDLTVGLADGKLWLFFLRDKKQFNYFTSNDSGATWKGPVSIHEQVTKPEWDQLKGKDDDADPASGGRGALWAKGWAQRYGCGPGNAMIQLKSGRLLVPTRHREDIGHGKLRNFAHAFYSDDHGATWKLGGTIGIHTSECQFVELTNGGLRVTVRDEMRKTRSVPRTGMAITIDLGGVTAGHPANKADYAARLSLLALHDVYGKPIVIWSGPVFRTAQRDGGRMMITFDHATGLKAATDELKGFAIAGADQKFVWEKAEIAGDKVIVSSDAVCEPAAVRYGWAANPISNLVNAAGLPASPFRTDDWK